MAISVVQQASGHDLNGAAGFINLVFGSNTTAGNSIIGINIGSNSTSALFFSEFAPVSDSQNNQYFYAYGNYNSTNALGIKVFVAHNIIGGIIGTFKIGNDTFNPNALIVYEVAGLASRDSFDKSAQTVISNLTAWSSGNTATTSFANELLIGAMGVSTNTVTFTAGSGYSNVQAETGMSGLAAAAETQIVSGTGTQSATATASALSSGLAAVTTFSDTNKTSPTAVVSLLGSTFNTTSGTHTVTATPAVNDLIVIVRAATGNTTSTAPTDNNADGNGVYTLVTSALKNTSADLMEVWVRNSLIGSATSTVFTEAPGTTTGGGLNVFKITGMTNAGSAAIQQSAAQANKAANTTPAPVFSSPINTVNPVIGAVFNGKNVATMTPPTGYYVGADVGYATPNAGLATMYRNSGETSTTLTWGGNSVNTFSAIAVELALASSTSSISVSDTATTSESINPNVVSFVNVSDIATTSENVNVAQAYQVNVSDTATTSESLGVLSIEQPVVSDTSILTESVVPLIPTLFVAVSDSSAISESIKLLSQGFVSVSDSSTTSESIGVIKVYPISVSDSSTTSENVQLLNTGFVNVNDSMATSESVKLIDIPLVNVSDSTATSENIATLSVSYTISVSDTVTTSENIQLLNTELITVNDSTSITESAIAVIPSANIFTVIVSDSLSISENRNLLIPVLPISVSDATTTSENISLSISTLSPSIAVSDTAATSESVNFLEGETVVVSDSVSVTEALFFPGQDENISVSDSVSISESVNPQNAAPIMRTTNLVIIVPGAIGFTATNNGGFIYSGAVAVPQIIPAFLLTEDGNLITAEDGTFIVQ